MRAILAAAFSAVVFLAEFVKEFVKWYTGERERLGRIAQRARMQAD